MTTEQLAKLPKWAQAEIAAMRERAAMMYALRWPSDPKPTPVDTAEEVEKIRADEGRSNVLFVGWSYSTYHDTFRITRGCSRGFSHSHDRIDRTTSQGGGCFFRTKAEAVLAARWEMCERFAKALAELDEV